MKKLLTMMVSCASALFAMADVTPLSGTDFQNYKVDGVGAVPGQPALSLNINKDDAGGDAARYWYSATHTEGIVDAAVTNDGQNAYLILDTSDVLQRTIFSYAGDTFASTNLSGNAEVYFDSKVQFTATEDDVTPNQGDKLVVWLKAVEGSEGVEGSTNLMITAGNGLADDDKAIPANYVVSGVDIEPNSWHRLTIKAFVEGEGDERVAFFNVYIDGSLVTGELDENQVTKFQSLIAPGMVDAATITSVGFKGTGAADNVFFYGSNPLGQDVTINLDDVEGYCAKIIYGEDVLVPTQSPLKINVPAGTTEVTLKCYLDSGAVLVDGTKLENDVDGNNVAWTWSGPITDNTITLTVQAAPEPETGAFTIDGVEGSYATLAEAFAAAEVGATIKLTADATVDEWLKVDKNVVLDLNGCTLTEQVDPDRSDLGAIYVKLGYQLTITDSSNDKNGKIASNGDVVIGNYGTVFVEAGTIESGDDRDNDVSIYNMNYKGTHIGTATINGGAVESVWNCGTVTVAASATVIYLDNSGKATIVDGATVTTVFLKDGKDAQGVEGAGKITAPDGLAVESGVEGYNVAYNEGVYSLAAVTYTITVETIANATAKVYVNEVELTGGVVAGTEYTVVVTPAQGYEYATAPDGWTKVDNTITKTGTVADANVTITVAAPTEIVITEPTIGGVEVEFDNSGVITNITSAANGSSVAGVADIAGFLKKFEKCYDVSVTDGTLSIALNDNAKPVIGEADLDGDEAKEPAVQIVNGEFKVTITGSYKSLKYKLQYKAGLGNDPATDKPYDWTDVATEEVGTKGGAMQLSAPANGDKGFYRVVVED